MLVATVCIDSEALSGNPLKSPERQFTIVHVKAADGIQRSYYWRRTDKGQLGPNYDIACDVT